MAEFGEVVSDVVDLDQTVEVESSNTTVKDGEAPLSKNAQKRLARQVKYEAYKLERRAREKAKNKEKQKMKAQKRAADIAEGIEVLPLKRQRLAQIPREPFKARLVIDLGFDNLMTEKEISSLCSQINYTYAAHRRAQKYFQAVLCTSLNGRAKVELDRIGDKAYLRWHGVEFWEESYERLWATEDVAQDEHENDKPAGPSNKVEEVASAPQLTSKCRRSDVIYLTADSENEITELKEGETYIIGGIVDRNRYKNLCQKKAVEQGIRTARLPIGTYLAKLPTRKVLTVNQVFEILVKWLETLDWEKSLLDVMPKRKFKDPNASALDRDAEGESEGEADESEDVYGGQDVPHLGGDPDGKMEMGKGAPDLS